MKSSRGFAISILIVIAAARVMRAQWPKYPTVDVPKNPDGKPNLEVPAPRTADGKPETIEMNDPAQHVETENRGRS